MTVTDIRCLNVEGKELFAPSSGPFDLLVTNIRMNGLRTPIYVNKQKVVIHGHYRFLAAREAGLVDVPVRFVESVAEVDLATDGAPLICGKY